MCLNVSSNIALAGKGWEYDNEYNEFYSKGILTNNFELTRFFILSAK